MDKRINGRATRDESLIDYRNRKAREYFKANELRLRKEFWARKAEA